MTQSEHPDAKASEISSLAGKEWQAMDEDEKAPYEEKNKEAKAHYAIQMANYQPPSEDEGEGGSASKKAV